jgi:hypothetical protein
VPVSKESNLPPFIGYPRTMNVRRRPSRAGAQLRRGRVRVDVDVERDLQPGGAVLDGHGRRAEPSVAIKLLAETAVVQGAAVGCHR